MVRCAVHAKLHNHTGFRHGSWSIAGILQPASHSAITDELDTYCMTAPLLASQPQGGIDAAVCLSGTNSHHILHHAWLVQRTNSSRDRWTPRMLPTVPEVLWRKTSQWVELTRPHAMRIVEDTVVDPVMKKHCTIGYDRKLKRCVPVLVCSVFPTPVTG